MTSPLRVLVLEDNVAHARFVRAVLDALEADIEVHATGHLVTACYRLATEPFDAVIADLHLPDGQGVAVVARLVEVAPRVPIVVVTALDDDDTASAALAAGAHDVLTKDRLTPELLSHALRLARQRSAGTDALRRSALLDPVTGSYNRPGLQMAARRCIAFARRQHHPVTVVHLTVQGGTSAQADALVQLVVGTVRDADLVGRFGTNRVCIVLPDDRSDPPAVLGRLEARRSSGPLADLGVEVSIAHFDPENPVPVEELLGEVGETGEEATPALARRQRALVVSEDIGLVQAVMAALGEAWEVLPASSLATALRVSALDEPDIALVDLGLSGDSLSVVRRIAEQPETATVPIFGISDPSSEADVTASYGRLAGLVDRRRVPTDLAVQVTRTLSKI